MSRLDGLLENKLAEVISGLVHDYDELKQRQLTSGRSGIIGYESDSGDTWDYNATITTPSGSPVRAVFDCIFIADGSQPWPIVNPYMEILVNGVEMSRNPNLQYQYSSGGNSLTVATELYRDNEYADNEGEQHWIYEFDYIGTVTVQMKLRTVGTSRGTVDVIRTS